MLKKAATGIMLGLLFTLIPTLTFNTQPAEAVVGSDVLSALLTNLEYPKGLWVNGDKIWLTETAGRNTAYGGKICLDQYDLSTGQKTVLVNNPESSDAVVVASDEWIYLTSYQTKIPGEKGTVSIVDPDTNIETHLLDIEIASEDMFIDSNDDILIIGSSDLPDAKSIYLLQADNYANPVILKTGLGRCCWSVSKNEAYTYFSNWTHTNRFSNPDGEIERFMDKSVMSISLSSDYLYYADYFGGKVGRVNIQTKSDETLASGLHSPTNVRYDESSDKLYFLEAGTNAAHYKDGTLKAIDLSPPPETATVDIHPDTLNLRSRGKWITAYIELPWGYNVSDIDISTVMLDDTIPVYRLDVPAPEPVPTKVGDYDDDGIPDLMVKFSRTAVAQYITNVVGIEYGSVTLTITGELLDGTPFEGTDTIRVLFPGDVDGDGDVDFSDFIIFAGCYGCTIGTPRYNQMADFNEDGPIDFEDFIILARNYGKTAT